MTIYIKGLDIRPADNEERDWTAELMAGSEPWITLGTTWEQCLKVCRDSEYRVFAAHLDGKWSGSIILHPRGLASSPYIKSVVVTNASRNRGVGASMIAFAGFETYFSLCLFFQYKSEDFL